MRPFVIHILILTVLIVAGIALFALESLSTQEGGGLIQKYTFTKLYGLAFIGYSLTSTLAMSVMGLFYKMSKRAFTKKAVVMSHFILVGLLWVFIRLGFHDLIQDAWENRTKTPGLNPQQVQIDETEKKRSPIPATPMRKRVKYKAPGGPVEPDEQKSD